jgi:hypothetical protein
MVSASDNQLLQKLLEIAMDAKEGADGKREDGGCRGKKRSVNIWDG